jgi:hypothetical protein
VGTVDLGVTAVQLSECDFDLWPLLGAEVTNEYRYGSIPSVCRPDPGKGNFSISYSKPIIELLLLLLSSSSSSSLLLLLLLLLLFRKKLRAD